MWKSHTIDAKAHNIFDDLVYEHSQKLQNEFYFILSIKTFSNISFSVKSIFRFIFTFIHTRNLRIFRRVYFDQYNYFFLLWMNILKWNDTNNWQKNQMQKTSCYKFELSVILYWIHNIWTTHKKNLSFENEHNYTYIISILKFKDLKMRKKHKKINKKNGATRWPKN